MFKIKILCLIYNERFLKNKWHCCKLYDVNSTKKPYKCLEKKYLCRADSHIYTMYAFNKM